MAPKYIYDTLTTCCWIRLLRFPSMFCEICPELKPKKVRVHVVTIVMFSESNCLMIRDLLDWLPFTCTSLWWCVRPIQNHAKHRHWWENGTSPHIGRGWAWTSCWWWCHQGTCKTCKNLNMLLQNEPLSIVTLTQHFKCYVLGKGFVLCSDHNSLRLHNFQEAGVAWFQHLANVQYKIEHQPAAY